MRRVEISRTELDVLLGHVIVYDHEDHSHECGDCGAINPVGLEHHANACIFRKLKEEHGETAY